ncbi:atherin-like [Ailuropoda melanoleuca]|uniref:atherin-like n=1 Tax=Ailuropoda melanoleuca TaxID=9646 RepID=UPI001494334C|nr:atherin-like [Ailuropoda melanoleuca]
MGARGRVREETGRGGRRGRGGGGGKGRGGGGGRKLNKLGLYPRARVSRFRLPPGGHHRGDRAAPHGREASPRERHGGAPQPPAAAAASSRQRPGLGGMRRGRLKTRWGGKPPPNSRTAAQGLRGLAFLSCPPGLSTPGARAAAAPGSAPRHSPRRRRHRSLPAPPPPRPPLPCQPGRQPSARSRTAARRRRQNTYRSAGGGGGVDRRVRVTGAGAGDREGGARVRRAGAGQLGPERAPPGREEGTGQAGGGEQENVGEVLARERELA